jgi:hypothetical protein
MMTVQIIDQELSYTTPEVPAKMELDPGTTIVDAYGEECPECPDPPDDVPPEITFVSPTPGNTIGLDDPLVVDVTDNLDALSRALLVAYIHDTGVQELVYDGEAFTARYIAQSVREVITNGFRFTLRRTGGWPNQTSVTVRVFAVDVVGNTES